MRKDEVMQKRLRKFKAPEGVVFIGTAQVRASVRKWRPYRSRIVTVAVESTFRT